MMEPAELLERLNSLIGEAQRLNNAEEYCKLADHLLGRGSPLQALELTDEGLALWPDHVHLACIRGRALARSGSTRAAAIQLTSVVERLRMQSTSDTRMMEEAIGVLARTEKDWAFATEDRELRLTHLKRSLDLYNEAYRQSGGYWTGINVATLATLMGDESHGQRIAQEVLDQCLPKLDTEGTGRGAHWLWATLGEACLNLKDWSRAESYYRQASQQAGRLYGDVRSMQRHVEWLLEHFHQDPSWTKKWLRLPAVAVFTGHMIDLPGRPHKRFPFEMEPQISQAIARWIESNDIGIGFGSAACGGDLLFLEAMQQRQLETHVILPCSEDEFQKSSVEIGAEGNWSERFSRAISQATSVIRTTREQTLAHAETYRHANQVIAGLARIKSRELSTDLLGLAVWDGKLGQVGGAADAVQEWTNLGIPMTRVALESEPIDASGTMGLEPVAITIVRGQAPTVVPTSAANTPSDAPESHLMYLMFADVVGYSQLNDSEIKRFANGCFGDIAAIIKPWTDQIIVRQTAGDGIYLAFNNLSTAGSIALAISKYFEETIWLERGFRTNLRLRTALHAGPIILAHDAITGSIIGVGAHVNRAARLEPKTPPGQVYASETFAALAALESNLPFECRYVKQLEWAKRYGTFPTYLVTST